MKKIITIGLLLLILVSTFYNSFAFELGQKDLKLLKKCEAYLKIFGKEKKVPFVVYQKDGKNYPAYCLDPDYAGIGTNGVGEYSVDFTGKLEDENMWKAIINGYPYKTPEELGVANEDEAYTATKYAVYVLKGSWDASAGEPVDTEAGRRTYQAYLNIIENAKKSTETLKDNNKISVKPLSNKWEGNNLGYASKVYKIDTKLTNGTYNVQINDLPEGSKITDEQNNEKTSFQINENFKVLIPIEKLKEDMNFTINITADLETKPVVYGKTSLEERQNYGIAGYMNEASTTSYKENCSKNITKLTIIKKEYGTEKRLANVKFNLLDTNKNIIKENLSTDENGEISIEAIIPGKYYIQEIQTLEDYNLYKDLIPVDIKFNEEIEIIVNNTLKTSSEITNEINTIEVVQKETEKEIEIEKETETKNIVTKKLPVTGY